MVTHTQAVFIQQSRVQSELVEGRLKFFSGIIQCPPAAVCQPHTHMQPLQHTSQEGMNGSVSEGRHGLPPCSSLFILQHGLAAGSSRAPPQPHRGLQAVRRASSSAPDAPVPAAARGPPHGATSPVSHRRSGMFCSHFGSPRSRQGDGGVEQRAIQRSLSSCRTTPAIRRNLSFFRCFSAIRARALSSGSCV